MSEGGVWRWVWFVWWWENPSLTATTDNCSVEVEACSCKGKGSEPQRLPQRAEDFVEENLERRVTCKCANRAFWAFQQLVKMIFFSYYAGMLESD